AVPGTLVNLAAGGGTRKEVRFGHPSGTLRVGAAAECQDGQWTATKAVMSRSARVMMEGWVRVPEDCFYIDVAWVCPRAINRSSEKQVNIKSLTIPFPCPVAEGGKSQGRTRKPR
ncbi:2-methylaconitate cis-trans isomerase PrpF family protein, partial [Enterobacter hormaechei subsp. steigerwaltii]|nr:2-methylaconitate cis-trans isomerase PrpF family protein [Enterobacter hormaechei subsp. steigerwaltii]